MITAVGPFSGAPISAYTSGVLVARMRMPAVVRRASLNCSSGLVRPGRFCGSVSSVPPVAGTVSTMEAVETYRLGIRK